MGFYYFSLMSIIPLAIVYGFLALVFWGIKRFTRGMPWRRTVLTVLGVVLVLLPISEELWIAWNFGRACKEAGTFISKTVAVDGYYDDTGPVGRIVGPAYKFIESKDRDGSYRRVERATDKDLARALLGYEESHGGKRPAPTESVTQRIDDRVQIIVEMSTGDAWRFTKLDHPSARFHFRNIDPMNGTPWAYKVVRSGSSVVIDTQTKEEIARYISFARRPPWFYIGLDVPGFGCDSPGEWPYTRKSGLIYREVLIPSDQK